eukprot:1896856-Prorocentrum_lima.AAC.1
MALKVARPGLLIRAPAWRFHRLVVVARRVATGYGQLVVRFRTAARCCRLAVVPSVGRLSPGVVGTSVGRVAVGWVPPVV